MTRPLCFLALSVAMLFSGLYCRGTDQTARSTPPEPAPQPAPGLEFETQQDTVHTHNAPQSLAPSTDSRMPLIRFMVQIGAFKDPQLASVVQTSARDRFHQPVLNDYNIQVGLYQVRIGFFETYESAIDFRGKLQTEFPSDYRDAWIVQLRN